jgi:hypothetical protein
MRSVLVFILLIGSLAVSSQTKVAASLAAKDSLRGPLLIQMSGIVISDSMYRIPFTKVVDITTNRGVIADYYGYFALVVHPGDTIQFSSIGYKKKWYIISDTTTIEQFSLVQVLKEDTLMSDPVDVYPWPSREQFAEYFVNMDVDDDALSRAKQRLTPQEMAFVGALMSGDAMMAYNASQQTYYQNQYTRGQGPQNNLLNPSAWADFLNGFGTGAYRISP